MTVRTYYADQELPPLPFHWAIGGDLHDFSTGWTFRMEFIHKRTGKIHATKTSGISGAATTPNVTAVWAEGELASIGAGRYKLRLVAKRDGDDFEDVFMRDGLPDFVILPTPTA